MSQPAAKLAELTQKKVTFPEVIYRFPSIAVGFRLQSSRTMSISQIFYNPELEGLFMLQPLNLFSFRYTASICFQKENRPLLAGCIKVVADWYALPLPLDNFRLVIPLKAPLGSNALIYSFRWNRRATTWLFRLRKAHWYSRYDIIYVTSSYHQQLAHRYHHSVHVSVVLTAQSTYLIRRRSLKLSRCTRWSTGLACLAVPNFGCGIFVRWCPYVYCFPLGVGPSRENYLTWVVCPCSSR